MAQRIAKLQWTPTPGDPTKGSLVVTVEGTDGDPSGFYLNDTAGAAGINTPLKVGLLLVPTFPDIDLPTA